MKRAGLPFYVGVTGMPPAKAAHFAVAIGAIAKSRLNDRIVKRLKVK